MNLDRMGRQVEFLFQKEISRLRLEVVEAMRDRALWNARKKDLAHILEAKADFDEMMRRIRA